MKPSLAWGGGILETIDGSGNGSTCIILFCLIGEKPTSNINSLSILYTYIKLIGWFSSLVSIGYNKCTVLVLYLKI